MKERIEWSDLSAMRYLSHSVVPTPWRRASSWCTWWESGLFHMQRNLCNAREGKALWALIWEPWIVGILMYVARSQSVVLVYLVLSLDEKQVDVHGAIVDSPVGVMIQLPPY